MNAKPAKEPSEPSDAELLERWRTGDRAAGMMLFERYYDPILRFFMNKVSVGAGDLTQATFTAAVERRDKIENPARFRAYLFSIAYNKLREFMRGKRRSGCEIDIEKVTLHELSPGPRTAMGKSEEQRLLLEGLRNIPARDQVILELHYWEYLGVVEIARIVGAPVPTVKGRLQRARKRLEAAVKRLAESPDVLHSTLADLDDWARACLDKLADDGQDEPGG